MKTALLFVLCTAFLCVAVVDADAACIKNGQANWALHYAGIHNAKTNTCAYTVMNCSLYGGEVVVTGPAGPGRFDVYVLALNTGGIAGTRYGLCSETPEMFNFYGWTNCADLEIASDGWPGIDEGNAQVWVFEQPWHVTLGILDVYVYPGLAHLRTCNDPRVGFAEWCDGASPTPDCCKRDYNVHDELPAFGYVGFGCPGYNPCDVIATENTTWGSVKSIYR